jgi:hypothetical protein
VAEALLACPGLDRAGQRTVAQLINRLHARGIVTTGVLVKIARLYVEDRSRIKNVFAYFSPGSEGFDFIRTRMSAELQVEEHEAIKLADPTWLTRKKGAA